jgi:hypothetical protein
MRNKFTLLFLPIFILFLHSCKQDNFKYTSIETEKYLKDITKNIKSEINFITESERQPSDSFLIVTWFPLSEKKLMEFAKKGYLKNNFEDLPNYTSVKFKSYELRNEKNNEVKLVDDQTGNILQKFNLWKYDEILSQNLGIDIKLDQKFEKLKGFISIEFKMPNGMKKETKIPVNISIFDVVTPE